MYCCKEFQEMVENYCDPVGSGLLYPIPPPDGQFEKDDNDTWNIYGCCGGGCYVVTGMKFCPFCGARLEINRKGEPK